MMKYKPTSEEVGDTTEEGEPCGLISIWAFARPRC
jgi:hypothetical protein